MTQHRATGAKGGHRRGSGWLRRLGEAVFIDEIPDRRNERRLAAGLWLTRTPGF